MKPDRACATAGPGDDAGYLEAFGQVIAAETLGRRRAEVLAIDPGRWPVRARRLRERLVVRLDSGSPEPGVDLLGIAGELPVAVAETIDDPRGCDGELAAALLHLQIDCVRVWFASEETAMRLRSDPRRAEHVEAHARLVERLCDARALLRARRWDEARSLLAAFRVEVDAHAMGMDCEAGRRAGGGP